MSNDCENELAARSVSHQRRDLHSATDILGDRACASGERALRRSCSVAESLVLGFKPQRASCPSGIMKVMSQMDGGVALYGCLTLSFTSHGAWLWSPMIHFASEIIPQIQYHNAAILRFSCAH